MAMASHDRWVESRKHETKTHSGRRGKTEYVYKTLGDLLNLNAADDEALGIDREAIVDQARALLTQIAPPRPAADHLDYLRRMAANQAAGDATEGDEGGDT